MKNLLQKSALALLSASLIFGQIAEAKRVGGGRSSGMQRSAPSSSPSPSYNSPRPSYNQPSYQSSPKPSYNQPSYSQNNNRNYGNNGGYQTQPAQPQRSGPGWGTVAGAAVAGAVAGAVLADDGPNTTQNNQNNARPIDYGTGGAPAMQNNQSPQNNPNVAYNQPQDSGGIGFFGWLILGLLAFFAYRFFKKKMSTPAMSNGGRVFDVQPNMNRMPDNAWPGPSNASGYGNPTGGNFGLGYGQPQMAAANHPDAPALLREARATFQRMQTMNSADQLNEIRRYLTDSMFNEIQSDISNNDALADFPELNARLIEVTTDKGMPLMSVEFSGLCSDAPGEPAMSFCETWHFVKQAGENQWRLAGIQQA